MRAVSHNLHSSHVDVSLDSQMELVREELEQCDLITDSIVTILDGFDRKLVALEGVMRPVYQKATELTTAQRNVEEAMKRADQAIFHHAIATEPDDVVEGRNISTNITEYLAWAEKVTEAQTFFQNNPDMKGGDRHLKRVRVLAKRIENESLREFVQIISKLNRPLDLAQLPWPLPDDLTLVGKEALSKLQAIAHQLDTSGHRDALLKELQPFRSSFLNLSLRKAWDDKKDNGETSVSTARYRRGHHPTVFLTCLCSKLLKVEHDLLRAIMADTTMREGSFCLCYYHIVHQPLDYFSIRLEKKLKEAGANRVLILLDIMENFTATMPMFEEVLNDNIKAAEDLKRVQAAHTSARLAFGKALADYREEIRSNGAKVLKDGTVCQLVVETSSCLKQIYQFEPTLQGLDEFELPFEEDGKTPESLLSSLTIYLLSALVENISKVTKAYSKQGFTKMTDILAGGTSRVTDLFVGGGGGGNDKASGGSDAVRVVSALFAMNNYHYIAKLCRKGEVRVSPAFVQSLDSGVKDMKKKYSDATWSKLIQLLDANEVKKQVERSRDKQQQSSVSSAIKNMFKGINQLCETAYHEQTKLSVPDSDLRSQLRAESVGTIIPKYEEFLRVASKVQLKGNKAKYEKYSVEQLEKMLDGFFGEN